MHLTQIRRYVSVALAVTGLVLAVSRGGRNEMSRDFFSITLPRGSSEHVVEWIGARNKQSIHIACGMFIPLIIRIRNACRDVKLAGIPAIDLWGRPHCLPKLNELLFACGQCKHKFVFIGGDIAIENRRIICKRITSFFIRDELHQVSEGENISGCNVAYIFHALLPISHVNGLSLWITGNRLDQRGGPTMDYDRLVLGLKVPLRLQVSPNIDSENKDASRYNYSFRKPLDLFCSTSRFPVSPKALFLLLAGFCCTAAGFASFFSCLSFRSRPRNRSPGVLLWPFLVSPFSIRACSIY